jgi:hypothetical protein
LAPLAKTTLFASAPNAAAEGNLGVVRMRLRVAPLAKTTLFASALNASGERNLRKSPQAIFANK